MAKGHSFTMGFAAAIVVGAAVMHFGRPRAEGPPEDVAELRLSLVAAEQRALLLEDVSRGHQDDAERYRAELAKMKGEAAPAKACG